VGGDRLRNLHFRLDSGLLRACPQIQKSKVILCLIGTNDLERKDCTISNLSAGIGHLIDRLKTSENIVVVCEIFARNDHLNDMVKMANKVYCSVCEEKRVPFLSLGREFAESDYEDHVHFCFSGYEKYAANFGLLLENLSKEFQNQLFQERKSEK